MLDILGKLLVRPPLVVGQVEVGPLLGLGHFLAPDRLCTPQRESVPSLSVSSLVEKAGGLAKPWEGERTFVICLSSLTMSIMSLHPSPWTSANSCLA